jgi:hypothetical protein
VGRRDEGLAPEAEVVALEDSCDPVQLEEPGIVLFEEPAKSVDNSLEKGEILMEHEAEILMPQEP